jgi:release factor glutamine methyltransferase
LTLAQILARARELLDNPEIEDPALESEVLLREVLKIDRVRLRLESSLPLNIEQEKSFWSMIERRLQGEPLAYIIRRREFFGLDFYVDRRVLIPRPETELLVEEALKLASFYPQLVLADVGTGSAAIAVSLAVSLPSARIYASDLSQSALEVAGLNCLKHGVAERVILLHGDLLEPIPPDVRILIANLPYVKSSDFRQMPSARFEPSQALDGGEEGLDQIFRFNQGIKGKLRAGGALLEEVGLGQSREVAARLTEAFPDARIEILKDLAGIERVVKMILPDAPELH